jgi:2-polyprenyl-3-methyl-5-hydroxy-6-metoxy-1,4-benzoquinol methylase
MTTPSGSIATATLDYTDAYDPDADFDAVYTAATGRRIAAVLDARARILELGCATGLMTAQLAAPGREIVAVDRSAPYLQRLRARELHGVTCVLADIEAVEPEGRFDDVVITNVLHEVGAPQEVLRRAAGWLVPGGRIHVTLPNPRSLHRLVAVDLGLIDDIGQLSARGARLGTRRMLDGDALETLARRAGLHVAVRSGVLLKPLPNAAMATLSPAALGVMEELAAQLPQHCAMTYLVLERTDA